MGVSLRRRRAMPPRLFTKLFVHRYFRLMESNDPQGDFIRELTGAQHWLWAFVRSLVADAEQADEVLQRVNLVLWRKAGDFAAGTSFRAWACEVVRFEVLAFRKERVRDRHVFGDKLVGLLADDAQQHPGVVGDLREALRGCLDHLAPKQRALVIRRYEPGESVQAIARRERRSADAVSASLYRIRQALLECIRRKLAIE